MPINFTLEEEQAIYRNNKIGSLTKYFEYYKGSIMQMSQIINDVLFGEKIQIDSERNMA